MLRDFDFLTPPLILDAIESTYPVKLDGSLFPYNSYVNRVFGVKTEDGREYVAKFYRPGRWTLDAIEDEHEFLFDCQEEDLPVIAAEVALDGYTVSMIETEDIECAFALFPKKGGRNFDAEGDEDWLRLGRLIARIHKAGQKRTSEHRVVFTPEATTFRYVKRLLEDGSVHPEFAGEWSDLFSEMAPYWNTVSQLERHRIHGDCHRGNILDRPGEGLFLIDFDDMAVGPAVQDLWLLLPGEIGECRRESHLLAEGYEDFLPFDPRWWNCVESLRLMRMVHFLAWTASQKNDAAFHRQFPDWGSKAFWIREMEDLQTQANRIRNA